MMNKIIRISAMMLLPLLLIVAQGVNAQDKGLRIIMIGAHPDDCDIKSGGTAALFASMGHHVKFVSVTNGDAGHHEQGGGMLAKRRTAETQESARRLGIEKYVVLDNHDGELVPSLAIRLQIIREIRKWQADVVIAPRPNDYHPDHRYTGVLVQDAAYMVAVPNIAPDVEPVKTNPVFLYFSDRFQQPNPFRPDIVVDIDKTFDKKMYALDAQVSQFYEWLPWIGGYADEVPEGSKERLEWLKTVRTWTVQDNMRASLEKWYGAAHAKNVKYAEAFQVCEYGKQPTDEDLKRLFPMLGK
ncbi:MAG: PIG-L family deacetylase [Cyclobacteriaceae bacterium]|nr:PIG-L family deacetylase [Cyclobacteriaceae bacterium]